MAKVKITEGAEYIHVFTTTKADAEKFANRFKRNKHIKSVSIAPYRGGTISLSTNKEIPKTLRYVVRIHKDGWWFSDEPPFRAGIRMLLRPQ